MGPKNSGCVFLPVTECLLSTLIRISPQRIIRRFRGAVPALSWWIKKNFRRSAGLTLLFFWIMKTWIFAGGDGCADGKLFLFRRRGFITVWESRRIINSERATP